MSNYDDDYRQPQRSVQITAGRVLLEGNLTIPQGARGVVLFAHGSGSSRFSRRNVYVARVLSDSGLGTLLIDLLTKQEELADQLTAQYRFDVPMLAGRLASAIDWLEHERDSHDLAMGLFGASTGAGAALIAAAERPERVGAVVSRGGRPDLAADALPRVTAPTLLIVGGEDDVVIDLNKEAMAQMKSEVRLEIVPGATHLFEEPGALEMVAEMARDWFLAKLSPVGVR
ncbi:MAG TPA: alpha/beta fold hydrolase [Tepidisphaeraceae bacterium]|nr:alpha/beta fold hydrolase [Tepidisphaeraceae bacterium]